MSAVGTAEAAQAPDATLSEPVGTSRAHTSEPRWPTNRPSLDASGRTHLVVAGPGAEAQASAAAWIEAAGALGCSAVVTADAAALEAALDGAPAGTRLLAAGDESTLARATSVAMLAGLMPGEIQAQLTDAVGPRPVQCVHCRTITDTTEPVDGSCDCGGCGVPLLIFPHYSRRVGAYLGFRIDAEELLA